MTEMPAMNSPWLVSVWPGMGGVALKAGEYLAEQLGMTHVGDFPCDEFFDVNHLSVDEGLARPGDRPRCAILHWRDPRERNDLVLLMGEAQPLTRGYELAHRVIEWAAEWQVSRIFAFAALATQMHPGEPARTFAAATTRQLLGELEGLDLEILSEGQITGLNGLMVAAAQAEGIDAACLLGEVPYFATQVANPKASRVVLGAFGNLAGIELDFMPLDAQAEEVDNHLIQLLDRMQQEARESDEAAGEPWLASGGEEGPQEGEGGEIDPEVEKRIERLFVEAARDRSRAFVLKRELDRLGVFEQYENRFLDLFTRGE